MQYFISFVSETENITPHTINKDENKASIFTSIPTTSNKIIWTTGRRFY